MHIYYQKLMELMDGGQLKVDAESGVLSVCSDADVASYLPHPKTFSSHHSSSSNNFSRYFECQNEMVGYCGEFARGKKCNFSSWIPFACRVTGECRGSLIFLCW